MGTVWGRYGESIRNVWEEYGESMGNVWGTYGERIRKQFATHGQPFRNGFTHHQEAIKELSGSYPGVKRLQTGIANHDFILTDYQGFTIIFSCPVSY